MHRIAFSPLTILFAFSVFSQTGVVHQSFDTLLKKYVDDEGLVDYKGLSSDRSSLRSYLNMLEKNPPKASWTEDERLAYWINAYNAFTLELILENYPVESIKDIGAYLQIPFVNTPWDIKFINIGDEKYDLNNIEHGIIRKEFNEPRIHFALVCAALSCPKLLNAAYFPATLDQQLDQAAKSFLRNPKKNRFENANEAELSKIFNWYGGDFKKESTLIEYVNQYGPIKLDSKADINWMDYDWALNEQ